MFEFLTNLFSKISKESVSNDSREEMGRNSNLSVEGPSDDSLRDQVTGLYNRKYLLKRLEANIVRCDRTKEKMAVILWDIDGFVDFNNSFGQEEGDRFLKKVAETIRRAVRASDEAFRSGGDEFCALLIPADETVATEVTKRVQQTVAKNIFEENPEYANRQFSISAGLVYYPCSSHVPEALLHEAGQALYRNRLSKA